MAKKAATLTLESLAAPSNASQAPAGHGGSNATDLTGGFMMAVTTDQLLAVFWVILPVVVITVVVFECVHRRWAGIDLNERLDISDESEQGQGMNVQNWLKGLWPLSRHFFLESEMSGMAKMLVGVLLWLSAFRLFMDWARNIWQRDFWDAIEAKHTHRFWKAMLLFTLMAIVNVLASTYQDYMSGILSIRWRAALTRNMQERWLMGRAFCTQHFPAVEGARTFDNPDQRLQEDIDGYITSGMAFFFGIFLCVGRLMLFTPMLYMISPPMAFGLWYCPGWLIYAAMTYSLLGSVITHSIGRYIIPLNYLKQQVEADYRHTAVQVRDHTESIALYNSEELEHYRLTSRFDRIQRVFWEQMKFGKRLGFFRNFFFLSNDIVSFGLLAGNYFAGQITLGQLMQIQGCLSHVQDSLNAFIDSYTSLADLRATTDRLWGFWCGVDESCKLVAYQTITRDVSDPSDHAALSAHNVNVKLPGDRVLWEGATLVVEPGQRVLLVGPDGCGKSLFLRAVAGCWPASGKVRIGRGDALFVPQKPYLPSGKLREAVSYPEKASAYTDKEMRAVLEAVRLESVSDVDLDEEADWQKRLSGGELQRLAIAHALLRKPGLLVLDESTSAIGEDGTKELYDALARLLPETTAVVSVDHDAIREVGNWHPIHYRVDPGTHKWARM